MTKYIFSTLLIISLLLSHQAQAFEQGSENELLNLINYERSLNGLDAQSFHPLLVEAAQQKAEAIFKYQQFGHVVNNLPFEIFIDNSGYNYKNAGENLAVDFTSNNEVVDAWMNSPLHKKNILYPSFNETGIAIMRGVLNGVETTVVVQTFGEPADAFVKTAKEFVYFQTRAIWVGIGLLTSGGTMGFAISFIERKRKRELKSPV